MYSRLITQANARSLASMGQPAFVNDTSSPDRYFTYPDIGDLYGVAGGDFPMSNAENLLTGQLTYDASSGTWPVNKSKRMWPR